MLQRIIDDLKRSAGTALDLTSLAVAAAFALLITTLFLCAAAFVYVLQKYGLIEACLTGAAIFFVITLITMICYIVRNRRAKIYAEQAAKSAANAPFADPMLMAAGIQIARAIGAKRLIPILVLGGVALGFLATRGEGKPPEEK
jgi:hypothetical protein